MYIKNATSRLDILKHFEMLKRKFCPGTDERMRMQLSYMGEDLSGPKLKELVTIYNDGKAKDQQVILRGASSIDLPPSVMKSFFSPLFVQIEDKVEELLNAAIKKGFPVDFVFMVGGFSESPYLKSQVKNKFENNGL